MALTVPSEAQLLSHMRALSYDPELTDAWVVDTLQQATDLMAIATNLQSDPADPLMLRVIQTGVMAMAHALLIQQDDKPAIYSPFQTEHMGSYSYTKMTQNVISAVTAGVPTGIPWFDTAVRYYLSTPSDSDSMAGLIGYSSENVFDQGWETYQQLEAMMNLPSFAPDIFSPPTAGPQGNPNDNFGG